MIYKLLALGVFLSCCSQTISNSKSNMESTGKFIMMPDNQEASFKLDLEKKQITINQNNKSIIILLEQAINYEDRYAAPKEKQLIKEKSKILHISKNVFNNDNNIEVLIQLAYELPTNNPKEFVLDLLISENGDIKLLGTTNWAGTSMGSHPVFAIIDDKAYYGIYDDRYHGLIDEPVGGSLYDSQRLNAIPYIMKSGFTNGTISYRKTSWKYSQEKGILIDEAIQTNQDFITKLIGDKEDSLLINHAIQNFDINYNPTEVDTVQVKTVATYNNSDYNQRGIRSLMSELGRFHSIKIVSVLMDYLEDDRGVDLPADDYGQTTISGLAESALSEIFQNNSELLINYKAHYVSPDLLTKWWEKNKHLYD